MKYLKLYENFFKDMELAADRAHEPVFVDEPKPEVAEPVEEPAQEPAAQTPEPKADEPVETTTLAPEPATYQDWLKTQVEEVVECTEGPKSVKCWVKLENGTSIQWELSMEEYPNCSASFKLGEDTVYLDDDTSGDIAREYYEKKREYDPKLWATKCIEMGKRFPQFMRRMEREAINRATDQDKQLSYEFAKIWGVKK